MEFEDRELADRYIREYKPTFLIGSPMCIMFSQLQVLSKGKNPEEFEARLKKAERHIEFVTRLYRMQLEGGRYFIHEHPLTASSWKMPCIRRLWDEVGVRAVVADQCEYGLVSRDRWGSAPAKKPTGFLTTNEFVACGRGIKHAMPK